jgi:hypothetical protein
MAGALELLEAAHEEREAHAHLMRECPWYQHVGKGGRDHPDLHCRPAAGESTGLHGGGALVKFTPHTPEASTVVKPTVPPGGPGLFHMKGHHLPPYIEHLYPHLVARYGKHAAYGVAVGIVKKWAAGVNPGGWDTKSGKGKRTHPDVRAAAARNVAQWEQEKAEAHEHAKASAGEVEGLELAKPAVSTAPGARPFVDPPNGGHYSQYGLYQNPVQSISPSPPLPPLVALPTAAEVRAVIPLVPDCSDASLSATARKFLEQAAYKLSKDNPLEALAVMRSAQTALYAAHKADMGSLLPSAYTANVFTRIPPAGQSSATAAMKQSHDRVLAWRKAEQALGALSDRIRKRYFHGVFNGPSQQARLTEDSDMTALDRLALAVVTGKDVSEPSQSDTSGAAPLIQPPEDLLNITDADAARQLAALPAVDKARVNAYLDRARGMLATNPAGAAQSALRAGMIARESGAHDLARHIKHHVQALADMGNMTHQAEVAAQMQAGGKTVSPQNRLQAGTDNPNGPARLTAVDVLLAAAGAGSSAGKTAGSSAGRAPRSAAPAAPAGHPDAHQLHVEHLAHLHKLHTEHVAHLEHLHHLHVEHMAHVATHPASHSTTPKPKSSTAPGPHPASAPARKPA